MTMTAEPSSEPISVPSIVLMTREEARACVDRIKALAEDVTALLIDLRDREGWKALGYGSWQDCIRDEFHMSRSYAHRLINAHLVERALTLPIGNIERLPESHARELTPLLAEPEKMQAALEDAVSTAGAEKLTAGHVHDAVDRQLGRPARPRRQKSEHRSVSSAADASDCQAFPEDDPSLGFEPVGDQVDANNETYGRAPNAERWCRECGDKYRGTSCPCTSEGADAEAGPGAVEPAGPGAAISTDAERAEGAGAAGHPAEAGDENEHLSGEDAPADQPEGTGPSAAEADTSADATSAPPAASPTGLGWSEAHGAGPAVQARDERDPDTSSAPASQAAPHKPHPSQEADRPLDEDGSKGSGDKTKRVSATRVFSAPSLDAGDVARVLLDLPTADVVEALVENATPAQRQALREAIGAARPAPTPAPAPTKLDIREALGDDGCTILELSRAIGETFTVDARMSLLALLCDAEDLPAERLLPLKHRLSVRTRSHAGAAEPTPDGLDTDEQRVEAALELLKQCGSRTVQAVEMKLPMLRKEIGARERAAAAAGSR